MSNFINIPSSANFLQSLINFIDDRELSLADLRIILPSRRAVRHLRDKIIHHYDSAAIAMPQIFSIQDISQDRLLMPYIQNQKIAISNVQKQLVLAKIIQQKYVADSIDIADAFLIAKSLISSFDELTSEEIDIRKIRSIPNENLAQHHLFTVDFFADIIDSYNQYLTDNNMIDNVSNLLQVVDLSCDIYGGGDVSVILAGSTASMPAVKRLAKSLLSNKNQHVIVQGYDNNIEDDIGEHHPQHSLSKLVKFIGYSPVLYGDICSRDVSIQSALNTSEEVGELAHIKLAKMSDNVSEGILSAIITKNKAIKEGSVAIISNDNKQINNISFALDEFGIDISDVKSSSIADSSAISLILLISQLYRDSFSPQAVVALCNHKLSNLDIDIKRDIDMREDYNLQSKLGGLFPSLELSSFVNILLQVVDIAEKISATSIWQGEEGKQVADFITNLLDNTKNIDCNSWGNFYKLLLLMSKSQSYDAPIKGGYDIHMLSPLEARLLDFDHIIMCGLNHGVWPKTTDNQWFSENMRLEMGLPSSSKYTGLAAYDFYNFACKNNVIITRSDKYDGKDMNASSWYIKLYNYALKTKQLGGIFLDNQWFKHVSYLYKESENCAISEPLPTVNSNSTISELWVTHIEKLMDNPYDFYARQILKLRRMPNLSDSVTQADFGNYIHNILEYKLKNKECDLLELAKRYPQYIRDSYIAQAKKIIDWFDDEQKKISPNIANHLILEEKIAYKVGDITIFAKPDRVDLHIDGSINIIDYKTGAAPSQSLIERGNKPQLALEALMLQEKYSDISCQYWKLSSNSCVITTVKNIDDMVDVTKNGVVDLLQHFSSPTQPYFYNQNTSNKYQDYRHLSRIDEWQN